MKIAFITEYIKPQVNGMAVRFTEIIDRIKNLENHSITVYGPKNHNVDFELITFNNKWNKDNFFCFPTFNLIKNIICDKYDIIYFVLPPFFCWSIIALIAKAKGARIVVSNHVNSAVYNKSYVCNKFLREFFWFFYKLVILYPQRCICDLILAPSNIDEINI
jgi:hypothetical protein